MNILRTNTMHATAWLLVAVGVVLLMGINVARSDSPTIDARRQTSVVEGGGITRNEYVDAALRFSACAARSGLAVTGIRFDTGLGHVVFDDVALGDEDDPAGVAANESLLQQCWQDNLARVEREWMRSRGLGVAERS